MSEGDMDDVDDPIDVNIDNGISLLTGLTATYKRDYDFER